MEQVTREQLENGKSSIGSKKIVARSAYVLVNENGEFYRETKDGHTSTRNINLATLYGSKFDAQFVNCLYRPITFKVAQDKVYANKPRVSRSIKDYIVATLIPLWPGEVDVMALAEELPFSTFEIENSLESLFTRNITLYEDEGFYCFDTENERLEVLEAEKRRTGLKDEEIGEIIRKVEEFASEVLNFSSTGVV